MSIRTLLVAVLLRAVVFGAFANVDAHDRSVEKIKSEIRSTLSFDSEKTIDPDAVPEDVLIALGDSVMGTYVRDSQQYEWMDEMMGSGWGLMGNPDILYGETPYESPEEGLKRRYAAGEISRRDDRRVLQDIQ